MNINKNWLAVHWGSATRRKATDMLIIHSTASNNVQGTLSWFQNPANPAQSSSHYVVGRDGVIYQCVDEANVAYHAGTSRYEVDGVLREDINRYSIGIEVVADDKTPYTELQMAALRELCVDIMKRHNIKPEYVLRHSDIAKGRKTDPYTINLDWDKFKASLSPIDPDIQDAMNRGLITKPKDLASPVLWSEFKVILKKLKSL